jgi:hypothetical protein
MLFQVEVGNATAETAITLFWRQFEGDPEGRSYADAIVRGVTDDLAAIDDRLRKASTHWRLERMSRVDRNLLRLGAWELVARKDVPVELDDDMGVAAPGAEHVGLHREPRGVELLRVIAEGLGQDELGGIVRAVALGEGLAALDVDLGHALDDLTRGNDTHSATSERPDAVVLIRVGVEHDRELGALARDRLGERHEALGGRREKLRVDEDQPRGAFDPIRRRAEAPGA